MTHKKSVNKGRSVEDVGVVRGRSRRSAGDITCSVNEESCAGTKGQAAAKTVPKPSAPTSESSSLNSLENSNAEDTAGPQSDSPAPADSKGESSE